MTMTQAEQRAQGAHPYGPVRLAQLIVSRGDWWALATLFLSVGVIFSIPALLGHPSISADNLIQNYPLRVLSGQQLAAGHLPLWNPLSFSGTPLLGAMNAGSLFPLTIPFAFLPGVLIWTINMMACYWAAGIGVYLVARYFGISTQGSLLAGLVFTFMGAQWGQMVHLGVIQGQGLLPWALLAMVMIADRLRHPSFSFDKAGTLSVLWPVLGLGAVTALVMLTGEPRAIADLEMIGLLVGIYGAWVARGHRGWRSVWTLAAYGIAALWGTLIGAIQLLPGYAFIGISQRSDENYWFFTTGSTALHHLVLLGMPLFYGTNGVLGQQGFFADYNLPEVTGYIGLIGLVAVSAGALQLLRRGSWRGPRYLWLFVGLAIAGLLLATAGVTPLGHVFYAIPLWGKTRLQSRSIIFFDLAGALLVGWFAQGFIEGRRADISLTSWRRWLSVAPLALVILSLLAVVAGPFHVMDHLDVAAQAVGATHLKGIYLVDLVLTLITLAVVLWASKMSRRGRSFALCSVLMADLVFFVAFATTGLTSGNAQVTPSRSYALSYLGTQGRFAIVDNPGANIDDAVALGMPNLNVFTQMPSVQGYGSLIASNYSAIANDHTQQTLGACQFAYGNFKDLRLASMFIGSEQLIQGYSPGQANVVSAQPYCIGLPNPTKHGVRTFYFGTALSVAKVSVEVDLASGMTPSDVTVMLRNVSGPDGYLGPWFIPKQTSTAIIGGVGISVAGNPYAVEMKVVARGSVTDNLVQIGDATQVTTAGPTRYWMLSGGMQDVMDMSSWRLTRMATNGSIFKAPTVRPMAWMQSGAVISSSMSPYGSERAVVEATTPTTLYFSESSLPGWSATITPRSGGLSRTVPVQSMNSIQSVAIPRGSWTVALSYRAPHLTLGLVASAIGMASFLGALVLAWIIRRRLRG